MPLLTSRKFTPPFGQFNGHWQTIIPSIFRRVKGVIYWRERLHTPDGDFLDLDWSKVGSKKLVLVSHGLEGSADRHYVRGVVKLFNENGWDACAWNCRSCSGEINWLPRFYHHADTPDIAFVMNHLLSVPEKYQEIVMVGFSMGGNLTLRYVGEKGELINSRVKKAVAVSTPIDLPGCVKELELPANLFYNKRFLKKIAKKVRLKAKMMPDKFSAEPLDKYNIQTLRPFDEYFTAPLHGFANATDFYEKAASLPLLPRIQVPSLLLNAINDPFLSRDCYPKELAKKHPFLFFEAPTLGGHVGFCIKKDLRTYSEIRALEFCSQ
jgi:hypothetical protein